LGKQKGKLSIEMNKKNFNKSHIFKHLVSYMVRLSCSSVSTRWRLRMLMNSRSDWWNLDWSEAKYFWTANDGASGKVQTF